MVQSGFYSSHGNSKYESSFFIAQTLDFVQENDFTVFATQSRKRLLEGMSIDDCLFMMLGRA